MSLMLINPLSEVFSTYLDIRMLVGIILIIFYLCLIEMLHHYKPSGDMRRVFSPITLAMVVMLIMILIRKLSEL